MLCCVVRCLTGLTRVRRFQQDDAHIFCRMDQIRDEVCAMLLWASNTDCVWILVFVLLSCPFFLVMPGSGSTLNRGVVRW